MSALQDCIEGRISPYVAVAHYLFEGRTTAEIEAILDQAEPHPKLDAMRELLAGRQESLDAIASRNRHMLVDHHAHGPSPEAGVARIAGFFDRAVEASPEASVAMYSLGDPALLEQATGEIVAFLVAQRLLAGESRVVDVGCGIGRVALALAPLAASVLGLDVSAGMVAEARRRAAERSNVRFEITNGVDLALLQDGSADLVLAVDSFPYIIQTGMAVVDRHFADIRRALRPNGALVLLNISYEIGDDDGVLARFYAERYGFRLEMAGEAPFAMWDGSASIFRRPDEG